jgi:hypothetical protein
VTKQEFIQVMVRVIGVCLLALGAWYSMNLLGNMIALSNMPRLTTNAGPVFIDLIIRIVVLLLGGSYLIRDGKKLFDVLNR